MPTYRTVDEETMRRVKNSALLEPNSIDARWMEKLLDFAGQFIDYVLFKD
jgi:hypothetical protein